MTLRIGEVRPEIYVGSYNDYVKGRWLSRKEVTFRVLPSELIVRKVPEARVHLYGEAGEHDGDIVLAPDETILRLPRECDLYVNVSEIQFAGGHDGAFTFWTRVRFIDLPQGDSGSFLDELEYPLSLENFTSVLSNAMTQRIGLLVRKLVAEFHYEPNEMVALTDLFKDFHLRDDVIKPLRGYCRMHVLQPFTIIRTESPKLDLLRIQRVALEGRLSDLSQATAEQIALRKSSLVLRKAEIEAEKMELARVKNNEEIRVAMDLMREEAEQKRRLAKAQADLAEARTHGARQTAELNAGIARKAEEALAQVQGRLAKYDKHIAGMAQFIATKLEANEEKQSLILDEISQLGADIRKQSIQPITMAATWRAHSDSGIINPALSSTERLPAYTMLDLVVSVSEEAYVYVLVKQSQGDWLPLVPDTRRIMGIERSNRQEANEAVLWPAVNHAQAELPFWMLDDAPGYERLIVLASIEQLDIEDILRQGTIEQLKKSAAPLSRGIGNPAQIRDSRNYTTINDYGRVLSLLTGDGKVIQETVIEHY